MPSSYFTMWGLLILMGLGAVGGSIYHGDLVASFSDAYPSNPAKQDALRRCGAQDASFSKFSAADRNVCYRALLTYIRTDGELVASKLRAAPMG